MISEPYTLTVTSTTGTYPVRVASGCLAGLGRMMEEQRCSKKSPILIVTDEHVGPLYSDRACHVLLEAGYRVNVHVVPAGELAKSWQVADQIYTAALQAGLDRQSTLIALGGGVVGDVAGFIAATYMRGIAFVQVPTTILAHDSSVGGKVGINHARAKNMIGAFHPPRFVLYDPSLLRTLPAREIRSGLAEVIKHGLIADRDFVAWCQEQMPRLLCLEAEVMAYALYRGCAIKADIVSADEREQGLRAVLNLGHTIGHALEAISGYGHWTHGEAIAIGMCGSALLAEYIGIAPMEESVSEQTEAILTAAGLPTRLPAHVSIDALIEAMWRDKKFRGGHMVFVLPTAIGKVQIVEERVVVEDVRAVLQMLQKGEQQL